MSDGKISRRLLPCVAALALVAAVGAGCGGGGDSTARTKEQPQAPVSAPGATPPPGTYAYRTRGYERVRAVIVSRLDYPRRSTITYRRGGCGVSERWSAGSRRSTTSTYCLEAGGRRLSSLEDVHRFFGQPLRLRYTCRGPVVPVPAKLRRGYSWTDRCRALGSSVVAPQRVVGLERVRSRGGRVRAVHLRTRARFAGAIRGTSVIDSWVSRRDGLVLRRVLRSDTRVSSPIGRVIAGERYEIDLRG